MSRYWSAADWWRQWHTKQEVDYLEEVDGQLTAWEIKWNPAKAQVKPPSSFVELYPDTPFTPVTTENIETLLLNVN